MPHNRALFALRSCDVRLHSLQGRWALVARWLLREPSGRTVVPRPEGFEHAFLIPELHFDLRRRTAAEAAGAAEAIGLRPGQAIATLHVRELGWSRVRGSAESVRDQARGADIETYRAAIRHLVERGYVVVRIGHGSSTPFDAPGLIDLATASERTDLLELWCVLRSAIFIAGDSGANVYRRFTQAATLRANIVNVFDYPERAAHRYLPKDIVDRATGRRLSLDERFTEEFFWAERSGSFFDRYDYLPNSSEELLEAVKEIADVVSSSCPPSAEQRAFRLKLDSFSGRPPVARRLNKPAAGPYSLGNGWVSQCWAAAQPELQGEQLSCTY